MENTWKLSSATNSYLGLLLSSNLSWSTHIDSICVKVRKLLGLLHIQFSANTNSCTLTKLYLSLIRPHLEYGAQVWHPYLSKDIQAIENVQKFSLRICSKKWNLSYWELLDMFQLPSLENRRLYLSLSTFYKIIYNLVSFPPHHLQLHVHMHPPDITTSITFHLLTATNSSTPFSLLVFHYGITY